MIKAAITIAAALVAGSVLGQGTFLYTWHGNLGLFQGSFQVTAAENQPGAYFNSQTFLNSIQFTSPDSTFAYSWPGGIAEGRAGSGGLADLSLTLFNAAAQRELTASADLTYAAMWEFAIGGPQLWAEDGRWTVSQIPEPCPGLLLLAAILARAHCRPRVRT
jgi:hypothetical protein